VAAVILFHYEFEPFRGGFVGVDIFFVISGFLITRWIVTEAEQNRFSFAHFYMRRARRLLPAMLVTLAVSFIIGVFLLEPNHFDDFGQSLVYSILSISNFLFWSQSGYFDLEAQFKPLLHFWSLSIEEQFYLLWPVIAITLIRSRHSWALPGFLIVVAVLSIYGAERWLRTDPDGAFFLMPFRAYELAIGGLLVWGLRWQPNDRRVSEAEFVVGLGMIVFAVFTFSSETRFPGLSALIPCIGAALVIHGGSNAAARCVLENRIVVGIGLISYSLYLVHWPLYVYFAYWRAVPLSMSERVGLVATSVLFACVMYWLVERPWRYRNDSTRPFAPRRFAVISVALSLLIAAPAAHAWKSAGWEWRAWTSSDEVRRILSRVEGASKRSMAYVRANRGRNFAPEAIKVLVVGDSHAKDFANAIVLNRTLFKGVDVLTFTVRSDCQPVLIVRKLTKDMSSQRRQECEALVDSLFKSELIEHADHIVLSNRWHEWALPGIPATIDRIRKNSSANIVLLGRTIEFANVPLLVKKHGRLAGLNFYVSTTIKKSIFDMNEALKTIAQESGVHYIDKKDFVCDDKLVCDMLDEAGNLNFYDYGHWTPEGAAHFGRKMYQQGILRGILH